ncbi:MAG: hemerythrin domain-containing protein [Candidatus Sericytochromatia bacterium]
MSDSGSFTLLEAAPGPDDPVGMLMACHRRLEGRLETLTRVVEVYRVRDEERYDQAAGAIGLVIRHLHGPTRLHHEDEELSLFPRMIARDAQAGAVIAGLEVEHEALEVQWAALLPVLVGLAEGDEPTDELVERLASGVEALIATYREHIRIEDQELYPMAKQLLAETEIAAVGQEMAARRHIV